MRHKSAFTLYTRKGFFYASFYNRSGDRLQRSTGVADNHTKTARVRAENAVHEWIAQEKADVLVGKPQEVLLKDFATDFYDWDGQWMKRQRAKGRQIGTAWAKERQRHVRSRILPAFGTRSLSEITGPMVERWLIGLPLANGTKNAILYSFRTIMAEGEAEGIISRNPLEKVEPMGPKAVARDILEADELRKLFPSEDSEALEIWKPKRKDGMVPRERFTLMLTMASTGIRVGEARALQWRHVLPRGWLYVERAVKADNTLGPTKGREVRVVALPTRTQAELATWRAESLFAADEDLVFYGSDSDKPINRRTFTDIFSQGLENAKIQTAGRVLVTHSLRHTYNTLMRRSLSLEALQLMVGHRSQALTDRYTHEGPDQLIAALEPERKKVDTAFSW